MIYNEVDGDLISLANEGSYDVILHGVNCFSTMKKGIAVMMAKEYGCDKFPLEDIEFKGEKGKLGKIDFQYIPGKNIYVVNCYTQYYWNKYSQQFDYDAFTSCMKQVNIDFKGMRVGMPKIGSGLGGGDWNKIKEIILNELKDCKVTVVNYV